MTDAEWTAFQERIERLAPGIEVTDSLVLTDEEREIIAGLDEETIAFIEQQLSSYAPQSIDIRTGLAVKGIASLLANMPVLADAVRAGYEAADA